MIDKNKPPTDKEIDIFLKEINFSLSLGFLGFYKETNGADVSSNEKYILLWPLTDLVELNKGYNVEAYAPEFFIFGSDGGGGTTYAMEKKTGAIYEMPFISISKDEAIYISENFTDFIENL